MDGLLEERGTIETQFVVDGPVDLALVCPLCWVFVDGCQSRKSETYSRRDLVLWDRRGAVSPTIRMGHITGVVSCERVNGVTRALIPGILDEFVGVDVF